VKNDEHILNLYSPRAKKARLGRKVGTKGYASIVSLTVVLLLVAAAGFWFDQSRYGYLALGLALLGAMTATWYKRDLAVIPLSHGNSLDDIVSGDILALLPAAGTLDAAALWTALGGSWQRRFITNHLLLVPQLMGELIALDKTPLETVWVKARELLQTSGGQAIEPGQLTVALLLTSPSIQTQLNMYKLRESDIIAVGQWLERLQAEINRPKPSFGGIARDWTFGFTPLLNQFGENISLAIMRHKAHFGSLITASGVGAITTALENHDNAIVLVGPDGIGKTSHLYALAQLFIEGKASRKLAYHQVVRLDAGAIISAARYPGELEQIVIQLANEAAHAGHVILFLDDAQLFLGNGTGSFDATQILLPVIQSRGLPLILALTSSDYQRLKSQNATFAGLLTPVVLQEPNEANTLSVTADAAARLENQYHILIAYAAVVEAYRLSGRYDQGTAYPGKAIKLLEQAVSHADDHVVSVASVQAAIEQTRGVRVGSAAPAEADQLLNMEAHIHQRMIGQDSAVKAVSGALRRARAGVADPRRPIGSFLFLGPTGVGKTELAKAIASAYFGSEANMVRLDMSEYQQPDDVQRLLSNGQTDTNSLILAIRQQPFTVVLLDEIEKAHPNVLNLLLQMLDEGTLTDNAGRGASFKDSIIIATSNAGATTIRDQVSKGEPLEKIESALTDELVSSGQFKPELLNRFDDIVLFKPLNSDELGQIVQLMIGDINKTLSTQNITVELTKDAIVKVVEAGYDARLGARPMRRVLQRAVEDGIAGRILRGEASAGDHIVLDMKDLTL
jgi:ATP-dependent Clp protease ATP-binding subunit ClpC